MTDPDKLRVDLRKAYAWIGRVHTYKEPYCLRKQEWHQGGPSHAECHPSDHVYILPTSTLNTAVGEDEAIPADLPFPPSRAAATPTPSKGGTR